MSELFKAIELEARFWGWLIQQPSYGADTTRDGFLKGCKGYVCRCGIFAR